MKLTPPRTWLCAIAFLIIGLSVASDALAQRGGRGGGGRGGGRGGSGRNGDGNQGDRGTFSIVRVGDEVQVVAKDDVEDLSKRIKKENADALKTWKDARTAATEKGGKFEAPKPEATVFKVLAQSVEGRRKAEEMQAELQKKLLASMEGAYRIVQVGSEFRVVKKAEIDDLQRELDKSYAKELDEYERKRRDGGESDAARPRRETVKILPKTFSTQAEARDYAAEREKSGPVPGESLGGPGDGSGAARPRGGSGGDSPR